MRWGIEKDFEMNRANSYLTDSVVKPYPIVAATVGQEAGFPPIFSIITRRSFSSISGVQLTGIFEYCLGVAESDVMYAADEALDVENVVLMMMETR